MTDYGTLEGTLQGAMILLRMDGTEAGNVSRQLLTLLDEATLNIHALYDLIPSCGPPGSSFSKVCDSIQPTNGLAGGWTNRRAASELTYMRCFEQGVCRCGGGSSVDGQALWSLGLARKLVYRGSPGRR